MEDRAYNFAAGPAQMPESVLKKAQAELLNWHGCGMSVMEMSHRGSQFKEIYLEARERLKHLLGVPETHEVLFLQGGATTQFAARIPSAWSIWSSSLWRPATPTS